MPRFTNHPRVPEPIPANSLASFEYADVEKGRQLGAGGDADVYKATISEDGTEYEIAIKEPRFDGTVQTEVFERFETEARTWATLDDHHNIVSVHGYGTGSLPWIALEYMDGGTLGEYLETIDLAESLWLAGRIAEGIRYGHRHGVAHLDLKPNNILLRETADGTWNDPKVSDWGLAKLLLEHSKSVEGVSPTYAAPEQFKTEEYGKTDDITDIYQFGAIVYELVTGKSPFTGSTTEVMRSVLNETPQPPSEVDSDLPQAIDSIILKALSKEKSRRYDSILLFQRQLDSLFVEQTDLDESELQSDRTGSPAPTAETTNSAQDSPPQAAASGTQTDSSMLTPRRTVVAAMGLGAAGIGGLYVTEFSGDQSSEESGSSPVGQAGETISPDEALTEIWSGGDGHRIFAGDRLFYTQITGSGGVGNGWALGGYNYQTGEEDYLSEEFGELPYGAVYGPSSYAKDESFLYVGGSWDVRRQGTREPNNATVYATELADGSLNFSFETPSGTDNNQIRHVRLTADGTVVFSVGQSTAGPNGRTGSDTESDPLVIGIDRQTGSESWRSTHSDSERAHFGGLTVYDDKVFATMDTIDVYDSSDGSLINQINYSAEYGVSISDDVLFTSGNPVRAYALSGNTVRWEAAPAGGGDVHTIEPLDERIYGATESAVFAIDRDSGERLWSTPVEGRIHRYRNSIDTIGRLVFASARNGTVYAMDANSGETKFTLSTDGESFRQISTIEEVLFVGGESPLGYRVTDEWAQ